MISEAVLGLIALGVLFIGILTGYPMAFTFIFIGLVFGFVGMEDRVFKLMQAQFFALMRNTTLSAIPLFLFMGFVLEQSGLMERVFGALRLLLGGLRGSLYLVVLLVATVFAAATGIVGASVTVLGVMASPIMRQSGYSASLSAGAIGAGGTLGILIPPSILLIVLGPVVGVPVTQLFSAAIIPGLILATVYIIYTLVRSWFNPELGPPVPQEELDGISLAGKLRELFLGVIPVTLVIAFTLGVIIAGVATPTDAAATGAFASLVLALAYRRMDLPRFKQCLFATLKLTAMIMFLLGAANFFGAVFSRLGSADLLTDVLLSLDMAPMVMLFIMLAIVFVLGSPLEWIPIVLVIVPIFLPTMVELGFDPLWFSILVAVTLQTSWLTPPMALSAYFLKGVVPQWRMGEIYWGMSQFVILQLFVVALLAFFPGIVLWLPEVLSN
jgi:tripartite ATP-independent transporter DctM subunit